MNELLRRSLDELPPQTRRLLELIAGDGGGQRTDFRFSRRDVRAHTGWGTTQVRVHLDRLEEMEYLIVHRGGARPDLCYIRVRWQPGGASEGMAGSKRPQNGGLAGTWRGD